MATTSKQHPLDSDLVVAQSVGGFRGADGQSHLFSGSSAGTCAADAEAISSFEVLERMLASKALFLREGLSKSFNVLSYPDYSETGRSLGIDEVCVRAAADPDLCISASGLSIHRDFASSVEHGVLELIERDILCRVWYGRRRLQRYSSECLAHGFQISTYSTIDKLPFFLAVVSHRDRAIFFSGSALAADLEGAFQKARNEALTLAMNLLNGNLETTTYQSSGSKRLRMLVDDSAHSMWHHFNGRLGRSDSPKDASRKSLKEILSLAEYKPSDVKVVKIRQFKELHLTRVFLNGARSKNQARLEHPSVIPDPFC